MPTTDFLWRDYSSLVRDFQDWWGVRSRSRSFGLGLSSALDILVLHPDAVDITRRCIQSLRRELDFAQNLQELFDLSLSDSGRLFPNERPNAFNRDGLAVNSADHRIRLDKLRDDFTRAVIFQNLVDRSAKFRRVLLRHRTELYIRIRNSILVKST
jgi:hypothetical protein